MPSFEDIFHSRGNDIGRLLALSDGVFAVVITLLVLELKIPDGTTIEHLPQALLDLMPGALSYALSFVVIGTYWSSHHRIFSYIRRYDAGLIRMNTLLLLSICFLICVQTYFVAALAPHRKPL